MERSVQSKCQISAVRHFGGSLPCRQCRFFAIKNMFKKRVKKGLSAEPKRKLDDVDDTSEPLPQLDTSANKLKKRKTATTSSVDSVNATEDAVKPAHDEAPKPKPKLKPLSENIKTITVTDFQPDVCKDFLQTGYCGYGDTCKFLHVRDELRQKKPVERDWEVKDGKDEKKIEEHPFKCVICKEDYKFPVKAQCGHVFCKNCFLDRYKVKKKPSCAICLQETNGIMVPVSARELATITGSS